MEKELIIDDKFKLVRLKDDDKDYKDLEKWYKEKEVNTYFEQREMSFEEIKNKYQERTKENAKVPVYMINYENNNIGIIQYSRKDQDTLEIDIFIGEANLLSKGIGSKVVTFFSNYLLKQCKKVIMCPLKDNIRAIKCYEKSGFKIIKEFEEKDTIGNNQVYLLMEKE